MERGRVVRSLKGRNKGKSAVVLSVEGSGADTKAFVDFDTQGTKTLILRFAKLKKITQ